MTERRLRTAIASRGRHGARPGAILAGLAAAAGLALVAGCATSPPLPPSAQISLTSDELVGKWGLASYREEADLVRTEGEAKRACANAYVIAKGPNGGVIMHLADESVPQELFLKPDANGQLFLGPQGKPADRRDRQVVSYQGGVLVARWVDPSVATRYGTMVFVRCGA